MIELRALGGLRLRDSADGHEILSVLARAKPSGLLVYLALSPPNVSHGRDELFELLWPGSSNRKARNSLNQALHVLRGGLGSGVIETTEGGDLILEAGAVWCDVVAFDEALASGHAGEALELYGGHLWDPSEVSDCPAFEHWLDGERQRLRLHAVEAAVTLAQEFERDGSYVDAAQWLRRAGDWAPFDEAVVRPLLKLLHGLGDRAAAVREYDAYEKRLADVELTSSTEITELIEKIRRSAAGPDPAVFPVILEAEPTSTPASSGSDRFWRGVAVGGFGAALATAAAFLSWPPASGSESPDLDPRLVLVRPFSNETGRPELDRLGIMAADWISQGLAETGVMRVVRTLPIDANAEINPAIAPAQSGSMRRAGTTVSGSFYSVGVSVSFQAQIMESASRRVLVSVGPVLASLQDPEAGMKELRQRTTGALASVVDPLLASWVTATRPPSSYEAYQLFAQGLDAYLRVSNAGDGSPRRALSADYFRRAADLDSTYALPLLWEVYARDRDPEGQDSILDDLAGRRDGLTRWEQHLLDALRARRDGDQRREYTTLSRLVAMTPGSEWNFRLATVAGDLVRYEEAITLLEEVEDQGWLAGERWYWWLLTRSRHFAGQYERELEDYGAFRARFPYVPSSVGIAPLAALGRVEEALRLARRPIDFTWLVSELFTHGHSEAAQSVIRNHLPKVALIDPNRYTPFDSYYNARLLFLTGRLAEAENLLRPLVEERPRIWRYWTLLVEVALARGDREDAIRIANHVAELDAANPESESKALAQAMIMMHLGDRAGALELMRPIFDPQRRPQQLLFDLHRNGPVPQSMADYEPFQKLVGWPPPLPN